MAAAKWDYAIETDREKLSLRGVDGWELVSVAVVNGVETFYFKRPQPSIREQLTLSQREQALAQSKEGAR